MSPREPAERQLERILHILPVARRPGGASIPELAAELGVPEDRILRDLAEVTAREGPPGHGADIQLTIEGDRVSAWTMGQHFRPVKLSPGESLALALGLRMLAEGAGDGRRERLRALGERLDAALCSMPGSEAAAEWELDGGGAEGSAVLALLREAARDLRPCRLTYLKGGAEDPEERVLEPYAMVYASGHWYALGRSVEADGIRAFRLDRILEARVMTGVFEVPPEFRAEEFVAGGGVFFADRESVARVRYSAAVAPWVRESAESGGVEIESEEPDGAVVVRHRVADPGWLVRRVLGYGPEAEILEPAELREVVARRARSILDGATPGEPQKR